MHKMSKFFNSSRVWTIITSALVAALVLVGGSLLMPNSPVKANETVELPAYQPQGQRAEVVRAESVEAAPVQVAQVAEPVAEAPVQVAQVAEVSAAPAQSNGGTLSYAGEIQAAKKVPVAVEVIGQVLALNVDIGDAVMAGDILLQVDSTTLEVQRSQALAGLKAAQAQLDLLLLDPNASNVAAAQASIAAANAAYQKAIAGPTQQDLEIAEAQLRQAQAAVKTAQAAYDQVAWSPNIGAMPQSTQLEQATLQVEAAEAQYEKITMGATQDVINGAYAQVAAANAQLANLQEGALQPQIDAVHAQIEQAETALYLTQLQVDKATVRAPIDGVISMANTAVGANVAPGAPIFEILSNDTEIVIEVEEFRLRDVAIGQAATIRVSAYPDREFTGEVALIAPQLNSSTRTVQVTIRPTGDAAGLLPGMYSTVDLAR